MMRITLTAFLAALITNTASAQSPNDRLTVETRDGIVHGKVDNSTPNVRQFLGIPYAEPPLGELRYAPPQPPQPFGELDAKQMPPSCMQYMSNLPSIMTREVREFNPRGLNGTTGPISEDCLTLSIWTPLASNTTDEKLPVLIFFYGGAFATGGTDVPYQVPQHWVQRTGSHIVVSFNHRDNIFGFPNAAGLPLEEQNVGLLDQRLAIEWVRDNIAAFGGDAERIGAWGHSSGAVSIAYYSYSYKDDPIVNSLIMDSGNEFIDILTRDPAHGNFTYVASQVGCGNLTDAEQLSCMRNVDAHDIEELIYTHSEAGNTPLLTFSPIIDNHTVFSDYTALAQDGQIANLPSLIGSTAQDGVPFVPYDPNGIDTELADLSTMAFFFCPTYQSAKTRIAANTGPVYRFLYSGNFTNISPKGWMGAWHAAELPLVFGTHPLYRGDSTELEYETGYVMQDAWLAFVATAGGEMPVEGWDGWGEVVEFGNEVPARLIDTGDMEAMCGSLV